MATYCEEDAMAVEIHTCLDSGVWKEESVSWKYDDAV